MRDDLILGVNVGLFLCISASTELSSIRLTRWGEPAKEASVYTLNDVTTSDKRVRWAFRLHDLFCILLMNCRVSTCGHIIQMVKTGLFCRFASLSEAKGSEKISVRLMQRWWYHSRYSTRLFCWFASSGTAPSWIAEMQEKVQFIHLEWFHQT